MRTDVAGWQAQLKTIGFGFVVCSLILAAGCFTRRDDVEVRLDMSSSVSSTAQLFYDTGSGYNESESRTAAVHESSLDQFKELTFHLPDGVRRLRFDPSMTATRFAIRSVEVRAPGGVLRILPELVQSLNQIKSRREQGNAVEFETTPRANDPSVSLGGDIRHEVRYMKLKHAVSTFLKALPLLAAGALVVLLFYRQLTSGGVVGRAATQVNSGFERVARSMSAPGFIQFDAYAIWFYAACGLIFLAGALADLNGSSAGIFSSTYGHGAREQPWIGAPRPIRSDEWAYMTPDILNQSLRANRFEARDSELGNHFAGLTGNIPVRHISTLFRPQLWPFFALRVDYAYAFNWQFKGLLLLVGVFTWLLLVTKSTGWAATGSLWFFFSPYMQWSYSWPSALPEMIGSVCLAIVLGCFLTVGRSRMALAFAAAGLAICCINFGMCAYPPHLVPLFWLAIFFFIGWCVAQRRQIFTSQAAGLRIAAVLAAGVTTGGIGLLVYGDLQQAIAALGQTVYPGKRVFAGGLYPVYGLTSHFLQWTERENRFPPVLGNVCEGSGFLWLAPVTILCLRRMRMTRVEKIYCVALWAIFSMLLAWLVLPLPLWFGALFELQTTAGSRMLPALGLVNVALVMLSMACLSRTDRRPITSWKFAAIGVSVSVAMLLLLLLTNQKLGSFFNRKEVLFAAVAAGVLITLLVTGRARAFALGLVLPHMIFFGAVNPVQRGLPVFTSSELFAFVSRHPELRHGKWLVFSDSVVSSGFVEATGLDVYTGLRHLPDIDHFGLFAANHYDAQRLNSSGFLTAHLRTAAEAPRIESVRTGIMQWDVAPEDPIVKELGIGYLAFDQPAAPVADTKLIPLAPAAVDGFWLYRLR